MLVRILVWDYRSLLIAHSNYSSDSRRRVFEPSISQCPAFLPPIRFKSPFFCRSAKSRLIVRSTTPIFWDKRRDVMVTSALMILSITVCLSVSSIGTSIGTVCSTFWYHFIYRHILIWAQNALPSAKVLIFPDMRKLFMEKNANNPTFHFFVNTNRMNILSWQIYLFVQFIR